MKVCIVGGTGNISTSFIPLLLELGHEVTLFNRKKSKAPDGYKLPASVRVIEGDRANEAAYEQRMQAEKFDYAIDMICFNRQQALSSIRAFRGVKHFIHCSTVCTYGVDYDWFPAGEDHPLRPISDYGRNKVASDRAFLDAHFGEDFPVTIIKPSSTYGPKMGALRQVAWDLSWVDRVRKGKPIAVCGDGKAPHQFLFVEDAAPAFVFPLGRQKCVGQIYNMTRTGFITWERYHRTAMKVLGREVDLVGIPLADLVAAKVPAVEICRDIFAHNLIYDSSRLMRDVPEFRPRVTLEEGLCRVFDALDREKRVPNSDELKWEDALIAAQRTVGQTKF